MKRGELVLNGSNCVIEKIRKENISCGDLDNQIDLYCLK